MPNPELPSGEIKIRRIKMKTTNENTQFNHNLKPARLAFLAALMLITFVAAVIPAAAQESPSVAQTNNASARTKGGDHSPAPPTAFGTNAKLALDYSPFIGVIRAKGVVFVSNPFTGVYCITPGVSLNRSKIYPLVSIEWGESSGNALLAFWRDTRLGTDCGSGQLEVQTFDFNAGGYPVASQNVAFDLVIE
jgi:hypothetical protein